MSKIRVGIVGYGNLGKASEMHVLNSPDMELVCIVSRRKISRLCQTSGFCILTMLLSIKT